ncbi:hypothetical protein RHGRI_029143 [Rhododendron griersonianum]|uniref:Anaphase-promoting complex subunit 1 beta-sandwich domain-containing protein n=1 Tax=Rhododendron griersonianum TaxID=479676 RepID=A0AAV6II66_9ERIC|nr:hypothetical protein RHGRI_029143 [Rhododendron griersonianum]
MMWLTSLRACTPSTNDCVGAGAVTIDQLVSTLSSDPTLLLLHNSFSNLNVSALFIDNYLIVAIIVGELGYWFLVPWGWDANLFDKQELYCCFADIYLWDQMTIDATFRISSAFFNGRKFSFQALYVLATEARWLQTVDVDTGLPVYAPLEMTIKETEHYGETSFCEVTPCILLEHATLKIVRVCGPRYWPQVIELVLEDKPWWSTRDKIDPFNSGVLYIKREVGSCSYVDDPVGCQSLLSRAMHKVLFYLCDHQLNISEAFVDYVVELRVLSSGFWFDKSESLYSKYQ